MTALTAALDGAIPSAGANRVNQTNDSYSSKPLCPIHLPVARIRVEWWGERNLFR
jgi:hypothetical protein